MLVVPARRREVAQVIDEAIIAEQIAKMPRPRGPSPRNSLAATVEAARGTARFLHLAKARSTLKVWLRKRK